MVDTSGVCMKDNMDKLVHIKFEGLMDEILVKIDPKLYIKYDDKGNWHTILYAALAHTLYENLISSKRFGTN